MTIRTIGTRIPTRAKRRGSHVARCDVCDVPYWDHQLRRMEDGAVYCFGPGTMNDADGRVGLTLDRLNAERAVSHAQFYAPVGRPTEDI